MKKVTIIGIIAVIILVGAFLIFKSKSSPFNTAHFDKDEVELDNFINDLSLFDQDDIIIDELDQTFDDILDKSIGVDVGSALNIASLNKEASEIDFSDDLTAFDNDEAIFEELNQAIGDVAL